MIKWLRRKMLEGMINDLIDTVPKAKVMFAKKKKQILDKAEKAVINTVKQVFGDL